MQKQFGTVSVNVTRRVTVHMTHKSTGSCIVQRKEHKTYIHTKTCLSVAVAALFIIAKKGESPRVHQLLNGQNVTRPRRERAFSQKKKVLTSVIL